MSKRQQPEPPTEPTPTQRAGIYYRHDADAEERRDEGNHADSEVAWMWAIARVNSQDGGYVVEVNAAGQVVRRHPREFVRNWARPRKVTP